MLHTNENPQPYQGPSYQRIKSRLQYPYLQRPHNPVTGSADCNFHQKFIWVELKIQTKNNVSNAKRTPHHKKSNKDAKFKGIPSGASNVGQKDSTFTIKKGVKRVLK